MKLIKFSHNWNNKLSNNIFTTIRKTNPTKSKYYEESKELLFEIILNGKKIGQAKLIIVDILKYKKINPMIFRLDTGVRGMNEIYEIFKKFGVKSIEDEMIIYVERK